MTSLSIVLPYVNPDLDGVACSIALEALEGRAYVARVAGNIDAETNAVLEFLSLACPDTLGPWGEVQKIWLVDTHNPLQLPADLPGERVVRILDHHLDGDPTRYPNATIQNEMVGAAATLVAERYFEENVEPTKAVAVLLQAAIASNTLSFAAQATSPRDRAAFARLGSISELDGLLRQRMHTARREGVQLPTAQVIGKDQKQFQIGSGKVVISQVEAPFASDLVRRPDLLEALKNLQLMADANAALIVLVDTETKTSAILSTSEPLLLRLADNLSYSLDDNGVLWVPRLLQRKTDVTPALLRLGDRNF